MKQNTSQNGRHAIGQGGGRLHAILTVALLAGFAARLSLEAAETANPDAWPEAKAILAYLEDLPNRTDKKVISGQVHGMPWRNTYWQVEEIYKQWGHRVGIIHGFISDTGVSPTYNWRGKMQDFIDHWNAGGLVSFSTEFHDPIYHTRGTQVPYTDLKRVITPGTAEYQEFKKQADHYAERLQILRDAGVVVLFVPFTELIIKPTVKWWAGRPPEDFKAMWRWLFDYFTATKGLDNLLWVFDGTGEKDWMEHSNIDYWPGNGYVDIGGINLSRFHCRPDRTDYYADEYAQIMSTDRPFAWAEGFNFDTNACPNFTYDLVLEGIKKYWPNTTYFMAYNSYSTDGQYRDFSMHHPYKHAERLLNDPWIISRDEINWRAYLNQAPAPAAPSGLSATPTSSDSITLAWTDNSADEAQFKIDRRQSGTTAWVRIATLAPDTTAHTDTGLTAETKFYYKVKAWNAAGHNSPYSNVADATTGAALPPPAAPSGLQAIALSHSEIRLDWTDNADDEDGFRIERRQSGTTLWVSIGSIAANNSIYRDTNLPMDTKFYYTVRAFRGADLSEPSAPADASTRRAPIQEGFDQGATWRYRVGSAEASSPAAAWRRPGFDDSGWTQGAAPFGYGPLSYGTDLQSAMKGLCSTLFLRRSFALAAPAQVTAIELDLDFDDGCVVWINGTEIARLNVDGPPYDAVPYNRVSDGYVSAAVENRILTLSGGALPALHNDNVITLQVLNAAAGSGDLLADLRLSVISEQLSVTEDADSDGMPDDWEQARLSDLSDPSDLSDLSDPDGDGVSNYGEWVAGTDPQSEIGNLKFEIGGSTGGVEVSFPTIVATGPGYEGLTRHYQLQRCSSPTLNDWAPVPGYEDRVATGGAITYQETTPAIGVCYRVRVWLTG